MNERQVEKKRREKSKEKHRKKVGEKTYKRRELEKGKIEHEIYMALIGLRSTVLMIIGYFDTKGLGSGADLGGGCRGCAPPPPPTRDDLRFSNTTGILQKKNDVVYWC